MKRRGTFTRTAIVSSAACLDCAELSKEKANFHLVTADKPQADFGQEIRQDAPKSKDVAITADIFGGTSLRQASGRRSPPQEVLEGSEIPSGCRCNATETITEKTFFIRHDSLKAPSTFGESLLSEQLEDWQEFSVHDVHRGTPCSFPTTNIMPGICRKAENASGCPRLSDTPEDRRWEMKHDALQGRWPIKHWNGDSVRP